VGELSELSEALDDLILGRGVARGRHSLRWKGRLVGAELEERLAANGFAKTTVRDAVIEPGEKIPAFHLDVAREIGPYVGCVILISSDDHYEDDDYAELIAGSPAVGFLSKATLSADVISRLVP